MLLLVAAAVAAALANFVPWWVAAGLGVLSGAAGWRGDVLLSRRAEQRSAEVAWAAAVSDDPSSSHDQVDGVLGNLLPERQAVPFSPLHAGVLHSLVRQVTADGPGRERRPPADPPWADRRRALPRPESEGLVMKYSWAETGCGPGGSRRQLASARSSQLCAVSFRFTTMIWSRICA